MYLKYQQTRVGKGEKEKKEEFADEKGKKKRIVRYRSPYHRPYLQRSSISVSSFPGRNLVGDIGVSRTNIRRLRTTSAAHYLNNKKRIYHASHLKVKGVKFNRTEKRISQTRKLGRAFIGNLSAVRAAAARTAKVRPERATVRRGEFVRDPEV